MPAIPLDDGRAARRRRVPRDPALTAGGSPTDPRNATVAVTAVDRVSSTSSSETWETPRGWRGTLSSVDHKTIGLRYLVTSIFFLVVGGIEALLMRAQLAVSGRAHAVGRTRTTSCSACTA